MVIPRFHDYVNSTPLIIKTTPIIRHDPFTWVMLVTTLLSLQRLEELSLQTCLARG